MDSKKAALKEILEFASKLKRDKAVKGVKKEDKEVKSDEAKESKDSPLDQILAGLKG